MSHVLAVARAPVQILTPDYAKCKGRGRQPNAGFKQPGAMTFVPKPCAAPAADSFHDCAYIFNGQVVSGECQPQSSRKTA